MTNKKNNEDSESRWSERAKAWSSTTEKGISKDDTFNQMIIKEVGIKSGEKVLDLASGSGNPAISIASFMKKRGQVFCTDITPSMLIVARQRAQHLNLKILKFIISDMQSQPFESEFFDAITCRFGIMFAKNKFNVVSVNKTRYILPSVLTLIGVCLGISSIKFALASNIQNRN